MSVKVSNWAWHDARDSGGKKPTGNMLILLLALADVAGDDGSCLRFVKGDEGLTYDALATKTGVDRRTIIRLVARLREEALVDHRAGVKGRPNEFVVLVPWAAISGDTLAPNGGNDSVTDDAPSGSDSVTTRTGFGDKPRTHSSYRRIDVTTDVGGAQKRAARIPEPFIVTAAMRQWAAAEVPSVNVDSSTRMFVDYWRAESGARASKRDWVAAWRNWLRKDSQGPRGRVRQSKDDRALTVVEMGRQLAGEGSKAIAS